VCREIIVVRNFYIVYKCTQQNYHTRKPIKYIETGTYSVSNIIRTTDALFGFPTYTNLLPKSIKCYSWNYLWLKKKPLKTILIFALFYECVIDFSGSFQELDIDIKYIIIIIKNNKYLTYSRKYTAKPYNLNNSNKYK